MKKKPDNIDILNEFLSLKKGAKFVSIKNYKNQKGNITNYLVICNFSYYNAKEKDITRLKRSRFKDSIMEEARVSLLDSLINNKVKETASNQSKTQSKSYEHLSDSVKVLKDSGQVYIFGKVVRKDVIEKGTEKPINSSELTIAKNKIRSRLHSTKYQMFALDKIKECKVNGKEIVIIVK